MLSRGRKKTKYKFGKIINEFKLVINTGRLKIKRKILFIGEQVVSAHTVVPQYTSVSLSRHFFCLERKRLNSKSFLLLQWAFFYLLRILKLGKKTQSAQVFQECNMETPQFLNSNHRLLKNLVPGLVKKHNITGHRWHGY